MVDNIGVMRKISNFRAHNALLIGRSRHHCNHSRVDQSALKRRTKEIAETRVRYGYQRIRLLLKREGRNTHAKRISRLYNEFGQRLRNKTPKRSFKGKFPEDHADSPESNELLTMYFVHNQLATRLQDPDIHHFGHVHALLAEDRSKIQQSGSRFG